jgi:drug/metabolite transporter (DMT)-like permease
VRPPCFFFSLKGCAFLYLLIHKPAFGAIYFLWGGTYIAIALGIQSISPFFLMGSRSVIGGAILFVFSKLQGYAPRTAGDWLIAAVSGILLFVGCHGALAYAEHFVPSGLSAVVLATIPFWIILVNLVIGRREQLQRLLGLFPGFVGVALIALPGGSSTSAAPPLPMMLLLLASALSWALGTVYSQWRGAHIPSHDLAGMQLICGGAALLLLSVVAGEQTNFTPQRVTIVSVAGLLYLALFGSAIANTAYLWLLDRMPAALVATYTFVNPVIALLLGWLILKEQLTSRTAIGAALVIDSIITLQFLKARAEAR